MSKVHFEIWTAYRPPVGFQNRGHNEYYFLSRCRRWHAREGNFGTMILTDHSNDLVHVVKGKMPEVEEKVRELLAREKDFHKESV